MAPSPIALRALPARAALALAPDARRTTRGHLARPTPKARPDTRPDHERAERFNVIGGRELRAQLRSDIRLPSRVNQQIALAERGGRLEKGHREKGRFPVLLTDERPSLDAYPTGGAASAASRVGVAGPLRAGRPPRGIRGRVAATPFGSAGNSPSDMRTTCFAFARWDRPVTRLLSAGEVATAPERAQARGPACAPRR